MTDHPISSKGHKKQPQTSQPGFSIWIAIQTILSVAVIMASILTFWTPSNLFSNHKVSEMLTSVQQTSLPPIETIAMQPTLVPARIHIGIVAGHSGNDSGAVCKDGLREVDVNLHIATLIRQKLVDLGFEVDLLQEFDKRLYQYNADALVSIHNDSCEYVNNDATGFKVAAAVESAYPEKANRLTNCLVQKYQETTSLKYHYNTVTPDMSSYHAFNEILSSTPAAIIETGFLNLDRDILTQHSDIVAQGVVNGIVCYLRNESISPQSPPTQ
jgi:N-acetylmuramoyl-L-alanine amidase